MEALIELAQRGGDDISINLTLPGVLALIAGILILVMPRLLNYIVAAYLIIAGLVMILDLKI